jgi:TonB-dependent starch-binding outer membrane protein SusC
MKRIVIFFTIIILTGCKITEAKLKSDIVSTGKVTDIMPLAESECNNMKITSGPGAPGPAQNIETDPIYIKVRCLPGSVEEPPVVILDGEIIKYEDLNDLSPKKFGSITILKDTLVTDLHFSHAKNGVIIITTKKAQKKALKRLRMGKRMKK